MKKTFLSLSLLAALLAGCDRAAEPAPTTLAAAPAAADLRTFASVTSPLHTSD